MFPVEIAREKSVGALKDVIKDKKKHGLHGIDADALTLWKVSLRIVPKSWLLISFVRFLSPVKVVGECSKSVRVPNLLTMLRNWTLLLDCQKSSTSLSMNIFISSFKRRPVSSLSYVLGWH